jgi:hypothetical protein
MPTDVGNRLQTSNTSRAPVRAVAGNIGQYSSRAMRHIARGSVAKKIDEPQVVNVISTSDANTESALPITTDYLPNRAVDAPCVASSRKN